MAEMTDKIDVPALFGLHNTNRNFARSDSWGKNQFNSSFPASLACYMGFKELCPVYLVHDGTKVSQDAISVEKLFGLPALSTNLYFGFEAPYQRYQPMIFGTLPRMDLVTSEWNGKNIDRELTPLEIKLTALPDNQTATRTESQFGCEVVIRPDTIVYLALSIATSVERDVLLSLLEPVCSPISDWTDAAQVHPRAVALLDVLSNLLAQHYESQAPLVVQPIWKTIGKSAILSDDCFDMFVWSDMAFARMMADVAGRDRATISRPLRSVLWLLRMLYSYAVDAKIDHKSIIDTMTYNTKNDKAFAVGGLTTNLYMSGEVLSRPRVPKVAIREIILGNGQKLLSPERRLDAAIVNSGLFDPTEIATIASPEVDVV